MATAPSKPTDEDMIIAAEAFKIEGNDFFKSRNIKKAMGKYHRAILQLKGVGSDEKMSAVMGMNGPPTKKLSLELEQKFNKLKTDCYNNLAACLLQEKEPNNSKIVEYCNEVLQCSPGNVKAHHRKGVALYHLTNYEESMSSLQKADQTDASTKKYMKMCKTAIEKQEIELQATYKAMFQGTSKTAVTNGSKVNSKQPSKPDIVTSTVNTEFNHLSSGDSPMNDQAQIKETT